MRVVPESSSLFRGREIIEEGVSRGYRTLCHTNGTVGVGCPRLKESVPVLSIMLVHEMNLCWRCKIYDSSAFQHGTVRQLIDHIDLYLIPLIPHNERGSLEGLDFCYIPCLQQYLGQEKSL